MLRFSFCVFFFETQRGPKSQRETKKKDKKKKKKEKEI